MKNVEQQTNIISFKAIRERDTRRCFTVSIFAKSKTSKGSEVLGLFLF